MAILRGMDGTAYVPTGVVAFTTQATTEVAYVYQINNAAMRIWDPNTPVVVSALSGAIDLSWYKDGVDYFTGRVKMNWTGTTVNVSGCYVTSMTTVAAIFGWTLNATRNIADTTPLGEAWRDVTPLGAQATVTLQRYRTDTQFDSLGSQSFVILKLEESTGAGWWVLAHTAAMNWTKAVGTVDQEAVTLEAIGPVTRY